MYQEIHREETIKWIKFWRNEKNKFHILAVHYTSDPDKNPETSSWKEWYEAEKESMPISKWNKEYEIDFTTKSGKLIYWKEFCDFDENEHFIVSKPIEWEYILWLDFWQRNPTHAIIAKYTSDWSLYIIDEFAESSIPSVSSKRMFKKFAPYLAECNPSAGITPENICSKFTFDQRRTFARNTFQLMVIDPTTRAKNRTKSIGWEEQAYSVIEDFYDNGWDFEAGINDVDSGITRIREYLQLDKHWKSNLYFFVDRCPVLCEQFTKYKYQSISEKMARDHNQPDKPVKKNDHWPDALRYIIMTRPVRPTVQQLKLTRIQKDIKNILRPKAIINSWDLDD